MTRNDRTCPNSHNHNGYWQSMSRIYLRKSLTSKTGKHGQQYVPYAWLCEGCGVVVIDPQQCRKCESKNIIRQTSSWARDPVSGKNFDFKGERYNEKLKEYKWFCFGCKTTWTPKKETKAQKLIILT